jgi:hypothetical protein
MRDDLVEIVNVLTGREPEKYGIEMNKMIDEMTIKI